MKSAKQICILFKKQTLYLIIIGALFLIYLPPVMCSGTGDMPVKELFEVSLEELFDQTVVTATKTSGKTVTQIYLALPCEIKNAVPIASAIAASSWFAVPKSGQIVLTVPP